MKFVRLPAIMALVAYFVKTLALEGARALIQPICMPTDAKLANPHKAYVAIRIDLGYKK